MNTLTHIFLYFWNTIISENSNLSFNNISITTHLFKLFWNKLKGVFNRMGKCVIPIVIR